MRDACQQSIRQLNASGYVDLPFWMTCMIELFVDWNGALANYFHQLEPFQAVSSLSLVQRFYVLQDALEYSLHLLQELKLKSRCNVCKPIDYLYLFRLHDHVARSKKLSSDLLL